MVSFISAAAHQKFMQVCRNLLDMRCREAEPILLVEKIGALETNLEELQAIAVKYKEILGQLPKLTRDYYILHRRIRIAIRKLQLAGLADTGSKKKQAAAA